MRRSPTSTGRSGSTAARPGDAPRRSSAPAISSPSATWTPATGRPRSPAARKFGYTLLVVALVSNIMAIILQSLCARLAIALGPRSRPGLPRRLPAPGRAASLWLLAEIAIIATDIAEVIGTAIGLNLIFGIPLEIGVVITALDVFLILYLQRLGFRWIEAFIIALLGVIAVCFGVQIALADPDWGDGDPRLCADHRDRHQSRDALPRARHPRRDRDAAQSLPPFGHRADPRLRRDACRRSARR